MKHTDDVIGFITDTLRSILRNDYTDATKANLYSHYIESVLITLLNAKRIGVLDDNSTDYSAALNQMVSYGLLSDDIPAFWEEHRQILQNHLQFNKNSEWGNPHVIHESLLSQDLNISEKEVWFSCGKISRDTTGSYYTPSDLAIEVVREAVEKYLKLHNANTEEDAILLLAKARFADLSCGCGEFIKAVQKYLLDRYNINPVNTLMNLYGIDIDPIALQITICDLLEIADREKWHDIIRHFILGNPLINQDNEKGITEKTRLFATKRYYASDMGIDMRNLFGDSSIDLIVGNPPWEKVRFEERKFFQPFIPEISRISQKDKRQTAIVNLKKQASISYDWYQQIADDYALFKNSVANHYHINKSLSGELNTYALFTELSLNLLNDNGILSLIVKSAIVTSPANKSFFSHIITHQNLASVCLYDNALRIFSIDSREKFCIITCTRKANPTFELIAGASKVGDFHTLERTILSGEEIRTINPNTQMIANITRNTDLQVLLNVHRRLPLFEEVYPECHFGRLVHLTAHAHYIDTQPTDDNLPIYEGKFIERYDARFSTFAGLSDDQKYSAKAQARKSLTMDGQKELPESRYYIQMPFWNKLSVNYAEPYMLCWRSLTSNTNARTTLAMLLPTMPTCQSIQFLQTSSIADLLMMLALFNSKPFDYFVRLKMPGIDLTQSVIRQIPVPCRDAYQQQVLYSGTFQTLEKHILERVSTILSREPMVTPVLRFLPSTGVQEKPRLTLEKEIDDLLCIAYNLNESEMETIQMGFKN